MDEQQEQQLERFGEAVEEKKKAAKAASEQPAPEGGGGGDASAEQPPLVEHGRPQDVRDVRAKNAGKGKKTADKWNQ